MKITEIIKAAAAAVAILVLAGIIGNVERGADIGGDLLPIMGVYAFLFSTGKRS